jgi:hypothetical protein
MNIYTIPHCCDPICYDKTKEKWHCDIGYERFLGPEIFFNPEIFSSDFTESLVRLGLPPPPLSKMLEVFSPLLPHFLHNALLPASNR